MNNDLISREALKKAIQEIEKEPDYQHEGETWQNGLYEAETLVDNAPTVRNEYMRGYDAAMRECKRPTGEWIDCEDRPPTENGDTCVPLKTEFCTILLFFTMWQTRSLLLKISLSSV